MTEEEQPVLPIHTLSENLEQRRWVDLDKLLFRNGPFAHEYFNPGAETKEFLQNQCKVLIIGAGGLGCDLVKNLAMVGFRNIDIIDMDTIDLSNLNRQFLFRKDDVDKSKAKIAADFINRRVPGVKVRAHDCRIQDMPAEYYDQFNIIISGLDSISARRWINNTVVEKVEFEDEEETEVDMSTVKIFIDGGTEGFKGQARVIIPRVSSCFECTMNLFPPQTTYPRCTIASNPRLPEHCIMYGLEVLWGREKEKTILKDEEYEGKRTKRKKIIKDDARFDGDNMDHVQWIYDRALERAKEHNIPGVSIRLTQGVVKNIIPAIASTNAVVASACANECLKAATLLAPTMSDYMMYNGNESVYTYTYKTEKLKECLCCGIMSPIELEVNDGTTLGEFIDMLRQHPKLQLKEPSVAKAGGGYIWNTGLAFFKKISEGNVNKTLKELDVDDEEEFTVVDKDVLGGQGVIITAKFV